MTIIHKFRNHFLYCHGNRTGCYVSIMESAAGSIYSWYSDVKLRVDDAHRCKQNARDAHHTNVARMLAYLTLVRGLLASTCVLIL